STGDPPSGWPGAVRTDPAHEHTVGAVNVNNGIAYAEIARYCDLPAYHGGVVAIDIANQEVVRAFFPAGRGVNGGGIWGPGGVSIDPATSHVFAATCNALTDPKNCRQCENGDELASALRVLGSN